MANRKPFSELTPQGQWKRLKRQAQDSKFDHLKDKDIPSAFVTSHAYHEEKTFVISSTETLTPEINLPSTPIVQCTSSITPSSIQTKTILELLEESPLTDSENDDDDDNHLNESQKKRENNLKQLREWSIKFAITHVAFTALLSILKTNEGFETLPNDSRTFLETPSSVNTRPMSPGHYSHFGLKKALEFVWHKVVEPVTCLHVMIGLDGIPLF